MWECWWEQWGWMLVLSMVGVECLDLDVKCQMWWVVAGNWLQVVVGTVAAAVDGRCTLEVLECVQTGPSFLG